MSRHLVRTVYDLNVEIELLKETQRQFYKKFLDCCGATWDLKKLESLRTEVENENSS